MGTILPGAFFFREVSFTPASVAAAVVVEQEVTVEGVDPAISTLISCEHPATGNATGIAGARIKALNKVGVSFVNPTAGALVPGAGTFKFVFARNRN